MHIGILVEGEVAIVRLEGRFITSSDAEYLCAKDGLKKSGKRKVMVDCSEVPYLDSTALNFLLGLYTSTTDAGGQFALGGLNPRMREVLRMTHLDEIIPIYDTRESALRALVQPGERGENAEQA
jgi:anti-sigma B factor antagonist